MPTGLPPFRLRRPAAGATWTNSLASPTTQNFNLPFYPLRNAPDHLVNRYINTATQFISESNRLRMASNGTYYEIGASSGTDGIAFNNLRDSIFYFGAFLTDGNGGKFCTASVNNNAPNENIPWFGSFLHEYAHAEDANFFLVGQRPVGYESYAQIDQHPPIVTLYADCVANGSAHPAGDAGHFITAFRVPHRLETAFGRVLKSDVRVVATGNITLSGTFTIDGVALAVNDRVLAAGQTDRTANGIYIVASGVWSRSSDANTTALLPIGTQVKATSGSNLKYFSMLAIGPFTLGTTAMTWHQDTMLNTAGAGTTGGTPQSRIDRWVNHASAIGWFI